MQEAFHNIAKYSHAQRVKLALSKTGSTIELAIEDNGQGFDINQAMAQRNFSTGLGLASMRERTELSDGAFEIRSIAGQGTVIHATWPLAPNSAASSASR